MGRTPPTAKEVIHHTHRVAPDEAANQARAEPEFWDVIGRPYLVHFSRPGHVPASEPEPPRSRQPYPGPDWRTRLRRAADATGYDRAVAVRGDDLRKLLAYAEVQTRHGDMLWDALQRVRPDEASLDRHADSDHGEPVSLNTTMGVLRYVRSVLGMIGRYRRSDGPPLPLTDGMIHGRVLAIPAASGLADLFRRGSSMGARTDGR